MKSCSFSVIVGTLFIATPLFAGDTQKPADLAKKIDARINERLAQDGVTPAPRADDAEFVRRVYLDLAGRIPMPRETYEFVYDRSANKRQKLVDRLLESPGYVNHFSDIWRALLLPELSNNIELIYLRIGFDAWIKRRVEENTPWDKLARELITAPIGSNRNGGVDYNDLFSGRESAIAYFQAKEGKPENIAAATARIFLGIHIECAQCHNHPFAKWSREQFWSTAAFFSGIERPNANVYTPLREIVDRREAAIPNTEKVVQAAFLDGKEPRWKFQTSSRNTFAEWMTAADNPFFARTAVNRIWAQMFGIGIVDPPDDFNEENRPSHPELLEEMAKAFAGAKYDVKFLIRAIAATEAYQRTSAQTDSSQSNQRLLGRMPVKSMSGEQLFDSLAVAVGYIDRTRNQINAFIGGNSPRSEFISKFAGSGRPTEAQTSILQALMLMNGKFIADATTDSTQLINGANFGGVAHMSGWSTAQKIETLYMLALNRKPRADELAKLVKYVDTDTPAPEFETLYQIAFGQKPTASDLDRVFKLRNAEAGSVARKTQRLGDVFWTLLNTIEFRVNH